MALLILFHLHSCGNAYCCWWWWWLLFYMGGGLLQLTGNFKNPNQLGPKSARQYCTANKALAKGQLG